MLIIETGSGIRRANSYVTVTIITNYLTERGRETENSWSTATTAQQEAAAIAATQYIDTRWGPRFKGTRAVIFGGANAQAQVDFSANAADGDTLTLDQQVYTFRTVLGTTLENGEVLIGADSEESGNNLFNAISGGGDRGTSYSSALPSNRAAQAAFEESSTTRMRFTAGFPGLAGNDIPLAATGNLSVTTQFTNGIDTKPQPLEFPRSLLFDRDNIQVVGVPPKVRDATAEYAVRAHAAQLYQDPTVDDTAKTVTEKFEKIGPIEERTRYEAGGSLSQLIRPYPAADRLLDEYVLPAGGAFR